MASKTTNPAINGSGRRRCTSWIDQFVEHHSNLESPAIFRRWAAIAAIGATLEQKVWLTTSSPIYPNIYALIIGHPGTGKTRTVRAAKSYLLEIPEFHFAPTSMSAASLVDALVDAKRTIIRLPHSPLEYNSMLIAADELGTFIHKYDEEMIAILSAFYDPDPYGQSRRSKDIKIKIKSPQLSILAGSTPSNLMNFMPEGAWDQGFTSRFIFVFSDERIIGDDFAVVSKPLSTDLIHDIRIINALSGEFTVTEDYRNAVNNWRQLGEPPMPTHPKLIHYATRRRVHLYKLSMISAIDRGNVLVLTKEDFNRAMNWLIEAETLMPEIFKAGATGADAKAQDEIYHFLLATDIKRQGLLEHRLVDFARRKVPAHSVMRVLEIMRVSGMIEATALDKRTGQRLWKAVIRAEGD